MSKIISVNGYKAFTGTIRVLWSDRPTEEIYGDWLYRPDTNCWYCQDRSFPAAICMIVGAD